MSESATPRRAIRRVGKDCLRPVQRQLWSGSENRGPPITRVRGNKDHVASHGYACEKAQRMIYYQSGKDRLDSPMRRRPDGSFEK